MTTEIKRLIRTRVEKGATFKRDGFGKKRQLSDSWRKPRGQHNKQREQKKAKGALPKPGFGSPVAVRGMHPSGFFEVLVSSLKELEGINPRTHTVRIGATVGDRKRLVLQETALSAGIKVLNIRTAGKQETKPKKVDAERFSADQKKKEEKVSSKSRISEAPAKKDTKKAKETPKAEEVKKAPVKKTKKPAKPKTEKAEKAEKIPEKPETAVPVKAAKKAVKPKTDESVEAKPKSAQKAKAKKKTESEVKKNE